MRARGAAPRTRGWWTDERDRGRRIRKRPPIMSRPADNLYWLARYVERAEYLARILEVTQRLTTLPLAYVGPSNEWESAAAPPPRAHPFAPPPPGPTRRAVTALSPSPTAQPPPHTHTAST